jgi:hypothetical protein
LTLPPFNLDDTELGNAVEDFEGPVALARRGLVVPPSPGVYIVASGDCVSHIGTSRSLRSRIASLAALGTHRGSAEVLCAAYCGKAAPIVWWRTVEASEMTVLERQLKAAAGEPPTPRAPFSSCVNGIQLRDDLIGASGPESWEAGYVEAVFAIGEKLRLLFSPRFHAAWREIGVPPGPWRDLIP